MELASASQYPTGATPIIHVLSKRAIQNELCISLGYTIEGSSSLAKFSPVPGE
jgi:hypothetical protein